MARRTPREKAAEVYCGFDERGRTTWSMVMLPEAFRWHAAFWAALRFGTGWQSLDPPPAHEEPVLVLDFFGDCEVAYWDRGFRAFQDAEGNELWATHWQPLPAPPSEGEGKP